jgi:hypothetical protein
MQLKSILEGYKSDLQSKKREKLYFKNSPQKISSLDSRKQLNVKEPSSTTQEHARVTKFRNSSGKSGSNS